MHVPRPDVSGHRHLPPAERKPPYRRVCTAVGPERSRRLDDSSETTAAATEDIRRLLSCGRPEGPGSHSYWSARRGCGPRYSYMCASARAGRLPGLPLRQLRQPDSHRPMTRCLGQERIDPGEAGTGDPQVDSLHGAEKFVAAVADSQVIRTQCRRQGVGDVPRRLAVASVLVAPATQQLPPIGLLEPGRRRSCGGSRRYERVGRSAERHPSWPGRLGRCGQARDPRTADGPMVHKSTGRPGR
jgi:hypothetical protein